MGNSYDETKHHGNQFTIDGLKLCRSSVPRTSAGMRRSSDSDTPQKNGMRNTNTIILQGPHPLKKV